VVCISGTDGADAMGIAGAVSEALGFRVVNEEVVARAAAEAGVDQDVIADVERRKSALRKIVDRFAPSAGRTSPDLLMSADHPATAATIGMGLVGNAGTHHYDNDELRGLIRSAIDELAALGEIVIVAHAASHHLSDRAGVLRVLITASPETRSARLSQALGIDAKEAESTVKKGDVNRADYLSRFYGVDDELPTHYDLVLNTDKLTPELAATTIAALTNAP
jgi:cytidylate kinase